MPSANRPFRKMRLEQGALLIPEIRGHLFMNALVTHDSKLLIGMSDVEQHARVKHGPMHLKLMEHIHGALVRIFLTLLLYIHANFTGRVSLGQRNRMCHFLLIIR